MSKAMSIGVFDVLPGLSAGASNTSTDRPDVGPRRLLCAGFGCGTKSPYRNGDQENEKGTLKERFPSFVVVLCG